MHCRPGKRWFLETMLVLTAPHVDHCNACTVLLHLSCKYSVDKTNSVSCLLLCFLLWKSLGFSAEEGPKTEITLLVYWNNEGMRTLSTCTFGPWKDCACQDGVPTSSWLEPSEQEIRQSQLIPRSTGNNNLLHVSKCLNRILWGLFQFFHAIIFFSSSSI